MRIETIKLEIDRAKEAIANHQASRLAVDDLIAGEQAKITSLQSRLAQLQPVEISQPMSQPLSPQIADSGFSYVPPV